MDQADDDRFLALERELAEARDDIAAIRQEMRAREGHHRFVNAEIARKGLELGLAAVRQLETALAALHRLATQDHPPPPPTEPR